MPPIISDPTLRNRRADLQIEPVSVTTTQAGKSTLSRSPLPISLYVERARNGGDFEIMERIDWSEITFRPDGEDCTAAIVVRGLDAAKLGAHGSIGTEHLKHFLERLHPDLRVRIGAGRGADGPKFIFQGFPVSRTMNWSERGQAISCTCLYEPQELLRTNPYAQVGGRKMRYNRKKEWDPASPDLIDVQTAAPIFNAEGKPNCRAERLTVDGQAFFAFAEDGEDEAIYWNAADALRYVAQHYIVEAGLPIDVEPFLSDTREFVGLPPTPDSADPFQRRMTARLADVSIQSLNAEQALAVICAAVGLHFEMPIGADSTTRPLYYLLVFAELRDENEEEATLGRSMGSPKVRDIQRDAPFNSYAGLTPADIAQRNEAQQAQLTLDTRTVNYPIFLGGANEFQVTLLLRPGWKPEPNVDNLLDDSIKRAALEYWEEAFGFEDAVNEYDREAKEFNSSYHPRHPRFSELDFAKVWRLWIFPDIEEYINDDATDSPYKRVVPPWDNWLFWSPWDSSFEHLAYVDGQLGGSIPPDEAKDWAPRPRPFLPTIGRFDLSSSDRTPIVWLNFKATDPHTALLDPNWRRYTGAVRFDARRAALWLGEENLIASAHLADDPHDVTTNMIEAYLGYDADADEFTEPHFFVAVTCVVRGDVRLEKEIDKSGSGVARKRARVIDLGWDSFVRRKRITPQAIFGLNPNDPDPQFQDRDDVERLKDYAERVAKLTALEAAAGSWEAPYVKTDVRLGDSFSGVSGLGIQFAAYPQVMAIQYLKDPNAAYRTVYTLVDLRHGPEVGTE